jgi:hypothetical protein
VIGAGVKEAVRKKFEVRVPLSTTASSAGR